MRSKYWYVYIGIAAVTVLLAIAFTFTRVTDVYNYNFVTEKQEEIEIRFMSSWGGSDTKAWQLQQLLDQFEKNNPGVKIINNSMSGDEFLFKLKTDFAQGNDPDVFGLWPGSDIKRLINAQKVADLTEILSNDKEWYESFGEDAWEYCKYNDRIYGLPFEIIYEGLFINRDLFEKYGVKVPETYEELLSAVRIFRRHNIIPIAYNSTPEGTFLYQNIVMKLGGKQDTENPYSCMGIEGSIINSCYTDAMRYMKELYDAKAFPENAFTIDNATRNNLFIEKKAAMIVQGSWFIGKGYVDPNDETVDIVPFPSFIEGKADKTAIIYGLGNGSFHMSSIARNDPRKKDICLKLLKHLTSVDSAKAFLNQSGFISNIKIPENELVENRLNKIGKELVSSSKELIGPTDSFIDRNQWESVLVKRFPLVLIGELTPEEVFAEMHENAVLQ
ncbi:MAG: ABC transporter substrate-binding protein [Bacillota bacterium]